MRFSLQTYLLEAAQDVVVCDKALGLLALSHFGTSDFEPPGHRRHHRTHYLILNGKNVLKLPIVPLSPEMGTSRSVNKLSSDTNSISGSAHASFDHELHSQPAGDLTDIELLAAKCERRIAG